MIVDGPLGSNMAWIAEYIDQLNEDEQNTLSQLVSELFTADEPPQELYFNIAEQSGALLKAPDQWFTPAFNLLIYVLSTAPDFSVLVPVILAHLNIGVAEPKLLLIMGVLANLFNIMPVDSKLRFDVLSKIIDFSNATGTLAQVTPQLSQLPDWLKQWKIDDETATEFYTKVIDLVEKHVGAKQAHALLVDANKVLDNETLAKRLVSSSLEDSFTFSFDKIVELAPVQKLNDPTLSAVVSGDVAAIKSDNQQVLTKARAIAFAKLASSNHKVTYDEISKTTGVKDDLELEILAIDAIKAGFFTGRMDQVNRVFNVESATVVGEFTMEHWKTLDDRLSAWITELKKNTEDVRSVPVDQRVTVPLAE